MSCEQKKIHFEDHKQSPWGISISFTSHWSTWDVREIEKGKQAEKLGVTKGLKVVAIDDQVVSKTNSEAMAKKLSGGEAQTITFQKKVNSQIVF